MLSGVQRCSTEKAIVIKKKSEKNADEDSVEL